MKQVLNNIILVVFNIILIVFNIIFLIIFFIDIFSKKEINIWGNTKDCVFETVLIQDEHVYAYATCFVIDRQGVVMTNKHVANVANTEIFILIHNERYPAKVEKISDSYDIAIMSVNYDFDKSLEIIKYNANIGDIVYTIGNPNGIGLLMQQGIISGEKKNLLIDGKNYLVVQSSLALNEGNSGGPLLNKEGKVIGIISFRMKDKKGEVLDSISFCYTSDEIISFLQEY